MIKYFIQRLTCLIIGHKWYIIDYFYGVETNNTWNINQCDRCRKAELD